MTTAFQVAIFVSALLYVGTKHSRTWRSSESIKAIARGSGKSESLQVEFGDWSGHCALETEVGYAGFQEYDSSLSDDTPEILSFAEGGSGPFFLVGLQW